MMTDIVGYTKLIDVVGDREAHRWLRLHDETIRNVLGRHAGEEIKHTGDGFLISFASPERAVACAVRIHQAMTETLGGESLRVRIGIHAGEPLSSGHDLHGASVNATARICARARPGTVLASNVVRELTRGKSVRFEERGRVALKGFRERFRLYEVTAARDPRRDRKGDR